MHALVYHGPGKKAWERVPDPTNARAAVEVRGHPYPRIAVMHYGLRRIGSQCQTQLHR